MSDHVYGDLVYVRVGISKRRAAHILDRTSQRQRTRTVRIRFVEDGKEQWVRPQQLEAHPQKDAENDPQ